MTPTGLKLVSVVVTTRNEETHIWNCLHSIVEQDYEDIEIIVVDNNSSDRTKQIAAEFTLSVFNHGPERAAQRNFGLLEKARGSYFAYIDADMVLSPDLISSCVELLEQQGNQCVGLHIDEMVLGRTWLAAIRRFERSFYSGTVVDGARFFRRRDFLQVGGFDESLPPGTEDWDLDIRLKQQGIIRLLPSVSHPKNSWATDFAEMHGIDRASSFRGVFHNETGMTFQNYFAKKRYYEGSLNAYRAKWGSSHHAVKKQLGPLYRYVVVFVENGKWRKLLRFPWLSVPMLTLRLAVGIQYLFGMAKSALYARNKAR